MLYACWKIHDMDRLATGSNGRIISPVTYSEEQIEALVTDTIEINEKIVRIKGFQVLTYQTPKYTEELRQKIKTVYCSNFSIYFDSEPKDRFEDFFCQLSNFATNLAKDHCFTDGNKRTTVKVSFALIGYRGIQLDIQDSPDPEQNELYKWIQDIVIGTKSQDELAQTLRDHATNL